MIYIASFRYFIPLKPKSCRKALHKQDSLSGRLLTNFNITKNYFACHNIEVIYKRLNAEKRKEEIEKLSLNLFIRQPNDT